MWAFLAAGATKWIVGGLVAVGLLGGIYWKGHTDGTVACVLKEQKQMARMEAYVKKIRDRIDRNEPLDTDLMRADPFKRDK
jgi:hypothetical protein